MNKGNHFFKILINKTFVAEIIFGEAYIARREMVLWLNIYEQ